MTGYLQAITKKRTAVKIYLSKNIKRLEITLQSRYNRNKNSKHCKENELKQTEYSYPPKRGLHSWPSAPDDARLLLKDLTTIDVNRKELLKIRVNPEKTSLTNNHERIQKHRIKDQPCVVFCSNKEVFRAKTKKIYTALPGCTNEGLRCSGNKLQYYCEYYVQSKERVGL